METLNEAARAMHAYSRQHDTTAELDGSSVAKRRAGFEALLAKTTSTAKN